MCPKGNSQRKPPDTPDPLLGSLKLKPSNQGYMVKIGQRFLLGNSPIEQTPPIDLNREILRSFVVRLRIEGPVGHVGCEHDIGLY